MRNFFMFLIFVALSQIAFADEAVSLDKARKQELSNEVIRLAYSLSECKKTPEYKLTTVAAKIFDMNGFILERRQIIDQENDKSNGNGTSDTARVTVANKQIQIMQDEIGRLFEEYKSLGGTENAPSSVILLSGPCKAIYSELNSKLGSLLKSNSNDNPSFSKSRIVSSSCPKPDYPKISLNNGQTGPVQVSMLTTGDGNVIYDYISKSTGYRLLDYAALDTAYSCKVEPFGDNGEPNLAWVSINFSFKLPN